LRPLSDLGLSDLRSVPVACEIEHLSRALMREPADLDDAKPIAAHDLAHLLVDFALVATVDVAHGVLVDVPLDRN
jgi:hypothetical protein